MDDEEEEKKLEGEEEEEAQKMDVDGSETEVLAEPLSDNALPWVEKYRPKTLDDLIAHDDIRQILDKLIASNKLPHLLFHGPPGTGQLLNRLF